MMRTFLVTLFVACTLAGYGQDEKTSHRSCCTPRVTDKDWYQSGKKAPLFKGLGGVRFNITTRNDSSRIYFNQGMMLSYGFNHAEAARSFYEAIRLDTTCAMCWWGYALVLGPNYNAGMEDDNIERAYGSVQRASALSGGCTAREKALIDALVHRYGPSPAGSRAVYDSAYAAHMGAVHAAFPDDLDIAALYAESLMDMHPWDLWEKSGEPKPWTPAILEVLERILDLKPDHAGANHFYIHATEASHDAGRATASADRLRTLVPGSGHLVHMPSHTYIRTGRYHDGSLANLAAVAVDSTYTETCHAYGVYPLAYYPHNYHFLAATATLEGNSARAMLAARKVADLSDQRLMRDSVWGTLQHYFSIPYYVMVKFGRWDEVLKEPAPAADLAYPNAVLVYARGMAELFGRHDVRQARAHLATLRKLSADESLHRITVWYLNPVSQLLEIATHVLEGEILASEKRFDEALEHMKRAIALEDALNYDEPPDWFFSVRHHAGAVLLMAGRTKEAEAMYREDLKTYPENGWALKGLYESLSRQAAGGNKDKAVESERVHQRFVAAWQYADVPITSSRPE